MASFVYDVAEEAGYDPCLICNVLDSEIDVRLQDVVTLNWAREIEHTTVNGMELKGIPRILPEFEFFQYVSNRHLWAKALKDGDVYFGVGGSNHCCLPLLFERERFGSWTATLFWEDRKDRLESAPLLRRIRDWLSQPIMEYLEGSVYDATDQIFVLSDHTARGIAERYGIDRERISVVPYPVDTETFNTGGNVPAELNDDRPTVLFVGRFNDPRKNVGLLLEAIDRVQTEIPNVRLVLIGDEPNDRVRSAIDRCGRQDTVKWIGYLNNNELPAYYRVADVFAIPSRQEGLAIVGLEAMACGTPVVSTRCGGPEDYIKDGVNGFTVSLDDSDSFADRLLCLLRDAEKRDLLSDAARALVESQYSESVISDSFRHAFETLSTGY